MVLQPLYAAASTRLPDGMPRLRERLVARTGMFTSQLSPDATPGDPGLFGPGSATWQLVGHPWQPLAGLRAALLQALSLPIPTATSSTGAFRDDFLGRVERTGAYVQAQNLGSIDEVFRSARRVRAMHRTVKGVDDGVRFDATDPHQTAWVSMTMTDSMLAMAHRFGGAVAPDLADRFVHEQSIHAALLDARVDIEPVLADPRRRDALRARTEPLPLIDEGELPTTVDQLRVLMAGWTPELSVSPVTRAQIDTVVTLDRMQPKGRRIARPFVLATLSTIPDAWHELVAPTSSRRRERVAAGAVAPLMLALRAVVGTHPSLVEARARVAATGPVVVG